MVCPAFSYPGSSKAHRPFSRPHLSFLVRAVFPHTLPTMCSQSFSRHMLKAFSTPSGLSYASSLPTVNVISGDTSPCSVLTRAIASAVLVRPPLLYLSFYSLRLVPTASALVRHSISVMRANRAQEVSHNRAPRCIPNNPNPILPSCFPHVSCRSQPGSDSPLSLTPLSLRPFPSIPCFARFHSIVLPHTLTSWH